MTKKTVNGISSIGIEFGGKIYWLSEGDHDFYQKNKKQNPNTHPIAGLRNLAHHIEYED